MADFCYFCKKKIGFFDTSSRTAFAQTVCGNCVNKVNRVAILYNREFSEYTLYSLEDAGKILEKAPSFEMYISRYLKIRAEYEPQIQHYQELAEKEKKTLKEIEKGMDDDRREYEAELKECEKEWKAERAYCALDFDHCYDSFGGCSRSIWDGCNVSGVYYRSCCSLSKV